VLEVLEVLLLAAVFWYRVSSALSAGRFCASTARTSLYASTARSLSPSRFSHSSPTCSLRRTANSVSSTTCDFFDSTSTRRPSLRAPVQPLERVDGIDAALVVVERALVGERRLRVSPICVS